MNFRFVAIFGVAASLILCASIGFGQVYSYVDEKGVRVFTNIAPTNPVSDLKVTGAPPPHPVPDPAAAKSNSTSQVQLQTSNGPSPAGASQRTMPRATAQNKQETVDVDALVNKYAA